MKIVQADNQFQPPAFNENAAPVWISLNRPTPETLTALGEQLGLDRLAIDDSIEFGQMPKLDDYPGSALLVFYGATIEPRDEGDLPRLVEVHFHVTERVVLCVYRHDSVAIERAEQRVGADDVDTAQAALLRFLDSLAASFAPPLAHFENELDAIEDDVMRDPQPETRQRLLELKHSLVKVRQPIDRQRDVMAGHRELLDRIPGNHEASAHNVIRDLYDRLALTSQQIEIVRELITNALDLYVSAASKKLNETMKVLTVVATFFLPLTFLVGFFGQNFGWMTDRIDGLADFLIFGLGVSIVFIVVLYLIFWRAGFLGHRKRERG
jgi:magnesium transporter